MNYVAMKTLKQGMHFSPMIRAKLLSLTMVAPKGLFNWYVDTNHWKTTVMFTKLSDGPNVGRHSLECTIRIRSLFELECSKKPSAGPNAPAVTFPALKLP